MQTPSQVARKANVTPQTIRNYSTQYGQFLSSSARGETGPRLYTDEDVEILCTIAALRSSGIPPDEIVERLQQQDVPPIVDVTPQSTFNEPKQTLKEAQDGFLAPQIVQTVRVARDEVVYSRLAAIEQTQATLLRAAMLWGVLLGAISALALGSSLLWVMWLAANGVP